MAHIQISQIDADDHHPDIQKIPARKHKRLAIDNTGKFAISNDRACKGNGTDKYTYENLNLMDNQLSPYQPGRRIDI